MAEDRIQLILLIFLVCSLTVSAVAFTLLVAIFLSDPLCVCLPYNRSAEISLNLLVTKIPNPVYS